MIRDENGMITGYVYVDITGRDVGGYVDEAKKIVQEKAHLPAGYSLQWSGQYENMMRVKERLKVVIPLTIFIIFLLLYHEHQIAGQSGHRHAGRAVLARSAPSGSCYSSTSTFRSPSGWA